MATSLASGQNRTSASIKIDVKGVIEVTKVIQPAEYLLVDGRISDEVSPNGSRFFLITRRHDLATNKNLYQLRLYSANAKQRDGLFDQEVLLELRSSSNYVFEHAIRSATWIDDFTISFIGEFDDGAPQAYTIDTRTKETTQLTSHAAGVLGFSFHPRSNSIVFISRVWPDLEYRKSFSYVASSDTINRLIFPEDLPKQELVYQYYRSFIGQPDSEVALGEPFVMGRMPPSISISPDGRWAIGRRTPRTFSDVSRMLDSYEPLANVKELYFSADSDSESLYTEKQSVFMMQFAVFDLREGVEAPWFDVPDATMFGREWPFAIWMPHRGSVVLANTFLPLNSDGIGLEEIDRRRSKPAIIEYWPERGEFRRIADLSGDVMSFEGIYRVPEDPAAIVVREKGRKSTVFRLTSTGAWDKVADEVRSDEHNGLIAGRLHLVETLNSPSEVFLEDLNGSSQRVTDLNPQLRDMDIGEIKPYVWQDETGREWRGGLMLPGDPEPGKRYPLVIQMYGFPEGRFYLDGANEIASAMAGRAYLGQGIAVFAMPAVWQESNAERDSRKALLDNAVAFESLINQLDKDGIVDPERVGTVGFSATGRVVQHLVTFSKARIRAATISDSATNSLASAVTYYFGWFKPGMNAMEDELGAKPWGAEAMTWARRDPSLHTDCIEAAMRLEFNDLYVWPTWDMYALLRRQYKAVEAIVFPRGAHQLRRPQERFDSLQGNVDWFRFWLKDEIDADPAKTEQYERWQKLKDRMPHQSIRRPDCVLQD